MQGSEPTPTADEAPDRVPDEVVADLLANERCRHVFAALLAADGPVAVCDLARTVLARERGVDPSELDDDAVASVREDLFQDHLPRLTPTGLVDYDSMLGTVALGDDERVRSALE